MYKWNKDKIQEKIKLLENMKKRNYLEEEALEYLESMINNDFKTFPYEQKDENLLDYLQDMAVIFKEIVVKQKEEKNFRKLDIDMKENDALELVYDFYKEQNEEFFRVFQNIFNTRFDNLEFSFRLSAAIDIPFFNESYINIFKSNDVTLLFDIVHEYAHSIAGQINFDFNAKKSYSLISESGALYFQKKFLDYLIKNNIFSKDAINEELIYDNSMIECAQNIIKSDNFLDVWSDCTYFHSFLVAVELYMSDDGCDQLYKLINEKIENMEDSLQVTSKYVDINRNIGEYQKKMIKLKEKITS